MLRLELPIFSFEYGKTIYHSVIYVITLYFLMIVVTSYMKQACRNISLQLSDLPILCIYLDSQVIHTSPSNDKIRLLPTPDGRRPRPQWKKTSMEDSLNGRGHK